MNASTSDLKRNTRAILAEAAAGHPVVVTDRGLPVARLVALRSLPAEWAAAWLTDMAALDMGDTESMAQMLGRAQWLMSEVVRENENRD